MTMFAVELDTPMSHDIDQSVLCTTYLPNIRAMKLSNDVLKITITCLSIAITFIRDCIRAIVLFSDKHWFQ